MNVMLVFPSVVYASVGSQAERSQLESGAVASLRKAAVKRWSGSHPLQYHRLPGQDRPLYQCWGNLFTYFCLSYPHPPDCTPKPLRPKSHMHCVLVLSSSRKCLCRLLFYKSTFFPSSTTDVCVIYIALCVYIIYTPIKSLDMPNSMVFLLLLIKTRHILKYRKLV